MTCNYNEYMLREIQQTLTLIPDNKEYESLRCELERQREEILEVIRTKW